MKKPGMMQIAFAFFTFMAVAAIISTVLGYFWYNSVFILAASLAATAFIIKKAKIPEEMPKSIFLTALLIAFLAAFPLLFITPFFPASSDAAASINLRVITDKIPENYLPYSGISYSYQAGFNATARIFTQLAPFIEDYHIVWAFGVLIAFFEVFALYYFSKKFFKNNDAAIYSAILLVATKAVFLNMYFGDHALSLGISLMMLSLALFHSKNRLFLLFLPATAIIHPGAALLLGISLLVYLAFYKERAVEFVKSLPVLVLAIPAIIITYLPLFSGMLSGSAGETGLASARDIFNQAVLVPLAVGLIPALIFIGFLAWLVLKKQAVRQKEEKFFMLALIAGLAVYFLLSLKNTQFTGKFFELFTALIIVLAGFWLAGLKLEGRQKKAVQGVLLTACIIAFLCSGQLADLRNGTKINKDEFELAVQFKQSDPSLQKTLFLTERQSKIAEFSNKIPFDVLAEYFLAANPKQVKNDSALKDALNAQKLNEKILEEKCIECIEKIPVKYIVVDTLVFPKLEKKELLKYKHFIIYEK